MALNSLDWTQIMFEHKEQDEREVYISIRFN